MMAWRVMIQFKRPDEPPPALRPTYVIGILMPIADAPVAVGSEPYGPCVLLLAEPEPGERPDTNFGDWNGKEWLSTRGERLDPIGFCRLPNKEEMKALTAQAGVDERDGRWTVMITPEAVH